MLCEELRLVGQEERYELKERIGTGGTGCVYRAEDKRIYNRKVAVKIIVPPDVQKTAEMVLKSFEREIEASCKLDHPHILPLYDYGTGTIDGKTYGYIVMPLCEGSLAKWLEQPGNAAPCSPQTVAHFVRQAASALQEAHDCSIIHKDVKPQNFLIRKNAAHPELPDLLLADFGVAKINEDTAFGNSASGTALYMSPEQKRGSPVKASDQYSLAIIAYELLAGQKPVFNKDEDLQRPSEPVLGLLGKMYTVLEKALTKKTDDRYSKVTEFAEEFQKAVHKGEDVQVIPSISEKQALMDTVIEQLQSISKNIATLQSQPASLRQFQDIPKYIITRPSIAIIIGFILVIIILVSSVYTLNQTIINNGNSNVQAISTTNARITATSFTYDTAVALANGRATVSAIKTATATILASNPYPSYLPGKGTLALYDPLTNSSSIYKWDIGNGCSFTGGAYDVRSSANFVTCTATGTDKFSDLTFEVKMTIISGDCGGIFVRNDGLENDFDYYLFEICQDGRYKISTDDPKNSAFSISSLIRQGTNQMNVITVVAKGDTFNFYVNSQPVATFSDSKHKTGKFGVFVDTNNERPTEVVFSGVKVWM